mgnify:CR=1 FL=1
MRKFKIGDHVVLNHETIKEAVENRLIDTINLDISVLKNLLKKKGSFKIIETSSYQGQYDYQIFDEKGGTFSAFLGSKVFLYENWLLPAFGKFEELE